MKSRIQTRQCKAQATSVIWLTSYDAGCDTVVTVQLSVMSTRPITTNLNKSASTVHE